MFLEFWEVLTKSLIKILSVRLISTTRCHCVRLPSRKQHKAHGYSGYLRVHKLVFRCSSFDAILGELHRIASVVDVGENLHWNHRP